MGPESSFFHSTYSSFTLLRFKPIPAITLPTTFSVDVPCHLCHNHSPGRATQFERELYLRQMESLALGTELRCSLYTRPTPFFCLITRQRRQGELHLAERSFRVTTGRNFKSTQEQMGTCTKKHCCRGRLFHHHRQ